MYLLLEVGHRNIVNSAIVEEQPFAPYRVVDYFLRIESQPQESLHAQVLLRLENAPQEESSENMPVTIVSIEKLCLVDREGVVSDREDANLQVHNHHVLISLKRTS